MYCGSPGSYVHGVLLERILEWIATPFLLQGIFPDQGLNPCLLHWQVDSLPLSHNGSPHIFTSRQFTGPRRNWGSFVLVLLHYILLLLFSRPAVSDSLWPHGLQHARPLCPSPSPGVCLSSYPLHWWCHPVISSSGALFFFCPQSFPASGTFPMSQLLASDDQNTGVSTSA